MYEILKELVHEPEKLKKYFIFLINTILVAIITSFIYEKLYGKYELILFAENDFWKEIYNFIISGRLIIISFIFYLVKSLITFLIEAFLDLINYLLSRIIKNKNDNFRDNKFIRELLTLFNVVSFDSSTRNIYPDKNFNDVYAFLIQNQKSKLIEDLVNIKKSLLSEVYTSFIFFSIVYYFFLTVKRPLLIDIIIIILFIIGTLLILILQHLYNFINANYDDVSFGLKIIKQVSITNFFIKENNITVTSDFEQPYLKYKALKFNNIEYILQHYYKGNSMEKSFIKIFENNLIKPKILLISNKKIPIGIKNEISKYEELTIIYFNNEEQLLNDLETYFIESSSN